MPPAMRPRCLLWLGPTLKKPQPPSRIGKICRSAALSTAYGGGAKLAQRSREDGCRTQPNCDRRSRTDKKELATALRLFASIFHREVDSALLREIVLNRVDLRALLGRDPLEAVSLDNTEGTIELLATEYCGLFIGPRGHMSPVESVVLGEGRYLGDSTQAVSALYQSLGIAPSPDARIVPDHISMELDCLAILEESGRHEEATAFARAHILRWLPTLVLHINNRATLAFYPAWGRGLGTMLVDFYAGDE